VTAAPAPPPPSGNEWSRRGPELWAELHRWALAADPATARHWLDRLAARVPCGDCRRHWLADVAASPPPTGNCDELFAWTVERHNQVNRRLGKPEMPLTEATQRWCAHAPKFGERIIARADLTDYFDAVWCINLDADSDRWETFSRQLAASNWPFCPVTRFPAIHGDTVGVPDHYHQGGGAWGCLQSHRRVLELSLMAHHRRILVMEDDVDLRPGFGAGVAGFLAAVGDEPWDCLMLGGQHMATPRPHSAGVVRATNIQRTHCMAFSRSFMRELYRYWSGPLDQHCDWSLGPFAARYKTFAPERFIAGQRGGKSWITGSSKPPEWWNPPKENAPVVWLRCPRDVLEANRDKFHAGNRRNHGGVCIGLADVFNPAKNPTEQQQIAALKNWISMIQWEVESRDDGSVCTIWHPEATAEVVKSAAGEHLIGIDAQITQEAAEKWKIVSPTPATSAT